MIGISIAATPEWEAVIKKLNIDENKIKNYPYGEYFEYIVNNENQINVFLHNIPIIMNDIFDNYIPKVIG